ncbi:hypothetical protein BDZ89DRAFT_897279, partial [Hymenopellis radicata]
SALHIKGYVNSMDSLPVKGKLDSGANIILMSEQFFNSRTDLPPLKLYQLTGDAKILRYTIFSYLVETTDGKTISFEVEAYIVREMITPLLLSEDFQTSYSDQRLGVERRVSGHCFVILARQGYRIEASSSLSVDLGFSIRQSFAHTSSFIPIPTTPPPVYAAQDTVIKPGYVQYLEVVADWGERENWIVDKVLIADDNSEVVAIATSWINTSSPYLPMANPGSQPIMLQAGELVGHLLNPDLDID